jgi:uncharacterized membrane protein
MLPIGPTAVKQGMTFPDSRPWRNASVSTVAGRSEERIVYKLFIIMSSIVILVPVSGLDLGCYLNLSV